MGVRAVQTAFQAVKNDEARLMARLMRVFAPGQIDKIAVRQLKALPVKRNLRRISRGSMVCR